jgi:hypothetical protein
MVSCTCGIVSSRGLRRNTQGKNVNFFKERKIEIKLRGDDCGRFSPLYVFLSLRKAPFDLAHCLMPAIRWRLGCPGNKATASRRSHSSPSGDLPPLKMSAGPEPLVSKTRKTSISVEPSLSSAVLGLPPSSRCQLGDDDVFLDVM